MVDVLVLRVLLAALGRLAGWAAAEALAYLFEENLILTSAPIAAVVGGALGTIITARGFES